MAKDFLGGITCYSGSDIEVVAFRDLTPFATSLRLDSIRKERKEIQARQRELSRDLSQVRLRDSLPTEILGDPDTLQSINLPSTETLNSNQDSLGKSQNQSDLRSLSSLRSSSRIVDEQRAHSQRLSDLDEEENDIRKESAFYSLGNIHTISYSSFREKFAIRTLGKVQAKGYTRGPRTIAGTMVFNLVQEHELMKLAGGSETTDSSHPKAILLDQIEPFNLMLIFSNEYGSYSVMMLFDIDIQSEGQSMSVEEIVTRNTMNFYATDIVPVTPIGNLFETYDQMLAAVIKETGGSPVLKSNRSSYRVNSRLEKLANSKASKTLDEEISDMLAESRGLF